MRKCHRLNKKSKNMTEGVKRLQLSAEMNSSARVDVRTADGI